jgi:outer membrane receptor protein involved in Fe transport
MKLSFQAVLKIGAAPLVMGVAMVAGAAHAADAKDDAPTIVVTGSLIKNPNLLQANPVNVTTANDIELKQSNTAEEVLREIPGIVPDVGTAVNNGNGGASFVNLRGLGSNRNLVLLDGQRIAPANVSGVVDLNNIPLALISRVDALTGAAVTTYGADAIAGVVNFVTKKDFNGIDLSVGDQITQQGDGNYLRTDLTVGHNFAEDRGNITVSGGYQNSQAVYQGARDISLYNIASNNAVGTAGAVSGSSTATPSNFSGGGLPTRQSINPTTGALVNGYSPYNFNPFNIFQTPFKRYNGYAQGNYKITDTVEAYGRGIYSHNEVDTIVAPSGVFGTTLNIPLSNPYIPGPALAQICTAMGLTNLQCVAASTATTPSNPNYRTWRTTLKRRMPEAGTRDSAFTTEMYDFLGGFRGKVTDNINFDVHASYGHSLNTQSETGYVLTSHVKDALLATNTTSCLSGNAGCVPLNIFGPTGSITPAMVAGLTAPSTTKTGTSLAQFHAQLSGETGVKSPLAETGIGFAAGTEYRKYTAWQWADALANSGDLGGAGGAPQIYSGSYSVWEGFGELIAPLIEDKALIKNLTAEGGMRYSKYMVPGGASHETTTYKAGLTWEVDSQVKFRTNYAHAVRAPNIGELFAPPTSGLTNLAIDPCAGSAPLSSANLRAVCIAQGASSGQIGHIIPPTTGQVNITTGGNAGLSPEKADTWTVGVVLQPQALRHFNVSVDYYQIVVNNAISSPTSGDLINACFGDATGSAVTAAAATSAACTSTVRDPNTGDISSNNTPGLYGVLSNLGRLYTNGVDVVLNYDHTFGQVKWTLNAMGNYTAHSQFQATPSSVNRDCVGFYSTDCASIQPKVQWQVRNTLTYGKVDASVLWRHIDSEKQEVSANAGATAAYVNGSTNYGYIQAYDYFDLALRFNVTKNFTFSATVQNLFDRDPPAVGTGIGTTSYNSGNTYPSTYDALGRRFAISAHVKY